MNQTDAGADIGEVEVAKAREIVNAVRHIYHARRRVGCDRGQGQGSSGDLASGCIVPPEAYTRALYLFAHVT